MKSSLLTEIRDWLETVATAAGLYLAWRWRPRRDSRDVTIKAPPVVARLSMPTPRVTVTNGPLLTGNDAGTQAVMDSMAEVFPYEFPPN